MIKIYVSPSCLSSKKVIQFFEEHKIPYIKRNIIQNPLTDSEIKLLLQFVPNGFEDIISTRAKYIKSHDVKINCLSMTEIFKLIQSSPTILKRPIIFQEEKHRVQVGYNEDEIELFLREIKPIDYDEYCELF